MNIRGWGGTLKKDVNSMSNINIDTPEHLTCIRSIIIGEYLLFKQLRHLEYSHSQVDPLKNLQ